MGIRGMQTDTTSGPILSYRKYIVVFCKYSTFVWKTRHEEVILKTFNVYLWSQTDLIQC